MCVYIYKHNYISIKQKYIIMSSCLTGGYPENRRQQFPSGSRELATRGGMWHLMDVGG
jgi:hypothetical protein